MHNQCAQQTVLSGRRSLSGPPVKQTPDISVSLGKKHSTQLLVFFTNLQPEHAHVSIRRPSAQEGSVNLQLTFPQSLLQLGHVLLLSASESDPNYQKQKLCPQNCTLLNLSVLKIIIKE